MTESEDENIFQMLTAFADGELDPARSLRVLSYLQEHPEAIRWLHDQQQLSVAAKRVLDPASQRAPASLRRRLTELAATTPSAVPLQTPATKVQYSSNRPSFGRPIFGGLIALAALILVAVALFRGLSSERTRSQPIAPPAAAPVVSASIVAHASFVHADCSRLADGLHTASFVKSDGELAADVQSDLHGSEPYPDLAPIGFRYIGAGPCAKPLANTIHLLYRTKRPGSRAAVSLFVQRYDNQSSMEPNRVYTVSDASSPFPMLVWRSDRVVYFLLADTEETEQAALNLIRGTASTQTAK